MSEAHSYRVEGTFYSARPSSAPKFFQGRIWPLGSRAFQGTFIDCHGISDVEGHLSGDEMVFDKRYDTRSKFFRGGSDVPIHYSLCKSEIGGWTGTWVIEGDDGNGFVSLVISEWDDKLPVLDPINKEVLVYGNMMLDLPPLSSA